VGLVLWMVGGGIVNIWAVNFRSIVPGLAIVRALEPRFLLRCAVFCYLSPLLSLSIFIYITNTLNLVERLPIQISARLCFL